MLIETNGVELHVESHGDAGGTPIVLLHGIGSSSRCWEWLVHRLAAHRRVVRMDLRGHGRSGRAPGTYDLSHFGADLLTVLREVTGRPATLVGHSMGGVTAWWTAQRFPDWVNAAFLIDPPLFLGSPDAVGASAFHDLFVRQRFGLRRLQARELSTATIARHLDALPVLRSSPATLGDILAEDALEAMAAGLREVDGAALDSLVSGAMMRGLDLDAPMSRPVFVLAADEGTALPQEHAARLVATHPTVEVARLAGSGHGIHDERSHRGRLVQLLQQFLDRHAASVA